MSKCVPEVGDVFVLQKDDDDFFGDVFKVLRVLTYTGKSYLRILIWEKETDSHFIETFLLENIPIENYKYLGKSKANINDLFKTEKTDEND